MRGAWVQLLRAGLMLLLAVQAEAVAPPDVLVREDGQGYRRIHIEVAGVPGSQTRGFAIWFADAPFVSVDRARLHSLVRVGDTSDLERTLPGAAFDDCTSDGLPMHRDAAGAPVIDAGAKTWSCSLSGMIPGVEYWIAVVPADAEGRALIDTHALRPVKGRSDAPDERPAPPDTRPLALALGSIVVSVAVLLFYLGRLDARRGKRRSARAHGYIAPALLGIAVLTLYPILYGIWLAFTDADQSRLGDSSLVGLANFVTVFAAPGVWRLLLFTLAWAVSNVVAHVLLGFLLALALNRPGLAGRTLYRTALLLPWAIPGYISILAWTGMVQPDGLLNAILGTQLNPLGDPNSARLVVILVNIWLGVPFMMMVFSAALQALPADMFEAAEVDGVAARDQLLHLTLPNIRSTLAPVSLLGFIWTFNSFNTIYLMTGGKPYMGFGEPGATDIMVTHVFSVAFEYGYYGVAAAWSLLIFLLLAGLSWLYIRATRATESPA